jgi:hypothetical protein
MQERPGLLVLGPQSNKGKTYPREEHGRELRMSKRLSSRNGNTSSLNEGTFDFGVVSLFENNVDETLRSVLEQADA